MASDHRFEIIPEAPEPRQRGKWATCLIGCLIAGGAAFLVMIAVGIWVARNIRGWAADLGSQAINQGIDSSDLPPQEKIEVKEQVERVDKAFRDGRISMNEAGTILEKVMKSPVMPTLVVGAVANHYFTGSGLSDEEKAAGRVTLKRFARGIIDKKIEDEGVDKVMVHIADRESNGSWQLRQHVSDEELRAALAAANAEADDAGIADQPEKIDASEALKRSSMNRCLRPRRRIDRLLFGYCVRMPVLRSAMRPGLALS
jgi:hypothetical protein